jgi:branched-chain amino acid transport system permease protein
MTTIWSGLSVGALYAVAGLLLTITLVRCGLINFAVAFYIILGNYLTVVLVGAHWNTVLIFVALAALGVALGGCQEVLTVRPTGGRHDTALVTTLGMGIAVQGFILAYWGPNPESVAFFGGDRPLTIFGGRLQAVDLWLIGLAVGMSVLLQLAVGRTRWGIVGRAAMTDHVASMLRGVNIPRLRTAAFAASAGLALAFGPISAPKMGVNLDSALHLVVFAFAAASIGGVGSFTGTAFGGFVLGLVEAFSSRYLGVDYAALLVFAILCTVLVIRPRGLFGARHLRVV